MAGTGSVSVSSATAVNDSTYRLTLSFDIAFDWGGWNSTGAPWSISCDGQSTSGTATFNIGSGGGNWVWGHIASATFDVARSTSARTVYFSASINTGVNPPTISASGSYTVPAGVFKYAPNPPTSVTLKKNSDTSHTLSWAFTAGTNRPIETQERALQTNDGSWVYTTINNGTTKSASLTTAANSKYYAAVRLKNSAGTSAWTYSNTTYTTPATPSAAVAIKTGTNVSLQATVSNIRYPKSYQWQRASNSSFSSGLTTLSGTAAVISDTTSLATPYYRVRCLGQSGMYSGWRTATLSTNPQLYVQIPTGKTIQDVYIRKG